MPLILNQNKFTHNDTHIHTHKYTHTHTHTRKQELAFGAPSTAILDKFFKYTKLNHILPTVVRNKIFYHS